MKRTKTAKGHSGELSGLIKTANLRTDYRLSESLQVWAPAACAAACCFAPDLDEAQWERSGAHCRSDRSKPVHTKNNAV